MPNLYLIVDLVHHRLYIFGGAIVVWNNHAYHIGIYINILEPLQQQNKFIQF